MTTTTTDYGVDLRVQLGIGRQSGSGRWDNASARWDAIVWGEADTSLGDWVDVTCETADPFTLTAGASDADGVVTRWEAATCALRLLGAQWDPWAGPWAGIVGPSVAVRVSWRPAGDPTWLPAFTGSVAADGWDYIPGTRPYANVHATDSTQNLAAFDPPERSPIGTGDTASQRVNRILDVAAWPANLRDVTTGGVHLKSSTMAEALWTQLLAVADTDLALMWIRRDGRLAYRPQGRVGVGIELTGRLVICPPNPLDRLTLTNLIENPAPASLFGWSVNRPDAHIHTYAAGEILVDRQAVAYANEAASWFNAGLSTASPVLKAGVNYQRSIEIWVDAASTLSGIGFGSFNGGQLLPANQWTRVVEQFTGTGAAMYAMGGIVNMPGVGTGIHCKLRRAQLMENISGATLPYFDGDTPDIPGGRTYSWTGTPNNSTSIAAPSAAVPVQVVTIGGAQFTDIRNIVSISRQKDETGPDATTATVRDDGSIARYLSRAYSRTDLQHQDDVWSTTVANAVLAASAWPSRAPREAVLSSRLGDPKIPSLLLSLEPDMTFDVEDTSGAFWREECVGWKVTVGRHLIDGTIELSDVSKWIAAEWGSAVWDRDRWSIAVTVPTSEET